jgi:tetratricopeptide (TPR) repeat protein
MPSTPIDRARLGAGALAALAAAIVAAVALLYWGTLDNPPVFDDRALIKPDVLAALGALGSLLDVRGLSYATLGWTHALVGDSMTAYRVTNLLLHAATCLALFAFLRALFEAVELPVLPEPGRLPGMTHWSDDTASVYAFAGAMLFALHPVAVYGVAYLVQRSIVMATLFSLLSLWCLLRGLHAGAPGDGVGLSEPTPAGDTSTPPEGRKATGLQGAGWYVASALAFLLAVVSKEHAVALPAVAVALALTVGAGGTGTLRDSVARVASRLRELWLPILLYALVAAYIVARMRGVLGAPYEPFIAELLGTVQAERPQVSLENAYPLSVLTQMGLFFGYLGLWLLPNPAWMSIDLRPEIAGSLWALPQVIGAVAWLAWGALGAWLLLASRRLRLAGFAMLAPWLMFSVELSTARIQEPFVLYRSYLWMFALPAALPLLGLAVRARHAVPALLALAVLLCLPAANRLATFQSHFAVWDDAVRKLEQPWRIGADRPFIARGLEHLRGKRAEDALADFRKALEIAPSEYSALLNSGVALLQLGQPADALAYYGKAAAVRPNSAEPLVNAAAIHLGTGDAALAARTATLATTLDPRNPMAWTNLAQAQLRLGQPDAAATSLERVLALRPDDVDGLALRAMVWLARKDVGRATADLDRAVSANPRSSQARYNRGTLAAQSGRLDEAIADWTEAIALDPSARDALANRATAYLMTDRVREAMADFDRLVALDPGNPRALGLRAQALARTGRLPEALADVEAALKRAPAEGGLWQLRVRLLEQLGRTNEARDSVRQACSAGVTEACADGNSRR